MTLFRDSRSTITPFMSHLAVTWAASFMPISAIFSAMTSRFAAIDLFESGMRVS